ncbi:MAG: type II toxin-antitoxin system Phd/YefM family antitoxin [Firmicutes bacterium]|nr:type II toxin-antitoxin system Phd/YefM family antitoxin [Bacillota bacterium]
MMIDINKMVPLSKANQNFSSVVKQVEKDNEVVILKNNKPKYVVKKFDPSFSALNLTDDEKIDIVAKRVLNRHILAFKELYNYDKV